MRNELNDLIRAIVDTRFAVRNVANTVIQDLRQGTQTTYRGIEWGRQHFDVMERLHQGVEAAWHYSKWLQFPEASYRLYEGSEALARVMDAESFFLDHRLTSSDSYVASPSAIEAGTKGDAVARMTVSELEKVVETLQESVNDHVENLNNQIAELEAKLASIEEGSVDQRKVRSRNMTDEERKAAGERMQLGRAKKLGLESIEQLHALKLRPGQKPTKKQISDVKKTHPAG